MNKLEKILEKELEKEIKRLVNVKDKKKKHVGKKKYTKGRGYPSRTSYVGGFEQPMVNPSTGIEEIGIQDFAPYQQALVAGYPAAQQVQDLTTVPYGQVANTVADLASLIPEVGPIIDLAKQATNALIGIFYKPKSTIANRLASEGVDIFLDNLMIVNPAYPDDDPKHFVILLPNGMTADAQDQARYSALIYYQKVLGFDASKWINRISAAEREYLFPSNDPQWPTIFGQLAIVHGHANPYLVTAKFAK